MRASSSRATSRKLWLTSAVGAFAALALAGTAWAGEAPKDDVFKVTTVIQVPAVSANTAGTLFSFDISWTDRVLNKYFLADRNNKTIDVVDLTTHSITQFPVAFAGFSGNNDTSGPDGLATVNNHTELWAGDSPGKVWVLDSGTGAVKTLPGGATNPIIVGGTTRADEFCTDTKNNVLMIASPAESPPFVTFISTTTYKVVGKLIFDGSSAAGHAPLNATNGLEQCGWSPKTGKFYQNVPEVSGAGNDTSPGAVAVIDPTTMKVTTSFPVPIADCAGPQGMAIGPNNQIMLGCNAKSISTSTPPNGHRNIVVIDAKNGTVLKTIPDLGGADEVWFNSADGHYTIASCNTACRTVPVAGAVTGPELLGVVDANGLRLDRTVIVALQNSDTTITSGNPRTIHSVAADGNQVFLPIPATGGNAPQFAPSLCDSFGQGIKVTGHPSSATGCIAILKAKNDDRPRFAREREHDRDDRHDR